MTALFFSVADDAFVFKGSRAKVDQNGQGETGGGQIIMGLGFVGWCKLGDGFDFEDDFVFYDEISDVVTDELAFVVDGESDLLFKLDAAQGQFVGERDLVYSFKEAAAEGVVDFHGSTYYFIRKCFVEYFGH